MDQPTVPAWRAYGAAACTITLWAAAFPAIDVAVAHIDPVRLAALRFGLAGLVFALWLAGRGSALPTRPDLIRIAGCGLLGIALYNLLLNTGQQTVSPGAASFIVATQPIAAAVLASVLGLERFGAAAMAGTGLSLAGVAIVSAGEGAAIEGGAGIVLILGAAICSGCFFVLQRPLVLKYGPVRSAAWTILAGAILLLPWLGGGLDQALHSPETLGSIALLSLGSGVLAYPLWMVAIAGLGAARAANLLFLMAPLATLISAAVLGQVPQLATLAGGVLTLLGVAIVHRSGRTSVNRAKPATSGRA